MSNMANVNTTDTKMVSTNSLSAATPSFLRKMLDKLGATDFWRWWTGELKLVFAPFSARWLNSEDDITEIKASVNSLIVGTATISFSGEDGAAKSADELKRAVTIALNGRAKDVKLIIPPEIVLRKNVSYPAATLENLHDVVAFDMDRQTPFKAGQVYFDARRKMVSGPDALHNHGAGASSAGNGNGNSNGIGSGNSSTASNKNAEDNVMVNIEMLAVPRQSLSLGLQALRDAGANVRSIGVANDQGYPRFDLLPAAEKPKRRITREQIINLVLLALILLFIGIAVIVPIWQKRERAITLQPLVQKAQSEAEATRKVEAEFTQLSQEYNFATGKKYTIQPTLDVVEEITRISPDTTWLSNLEVKTLTNKSGPPIRELQLTGEAASATKMVELLEQSKLMQNASQRTQTTRGSQPTLDRFQIATELKTRPLPAAVAMDELLADNSAKVNVNAPASGVVNANSQPDALTKSQPNSQLNAQPNSAANANTVPVAVVVPNPAPVIAPQKSGAGAAPPASAKPTAPKAPASLVPGVVSGDATNTIFNTTPPKLPAQPANIKRAAPQPVPQMLPPGSVPAMPTPPPPTIYPVPPVLPVQPTQPAPPEVPHRSKP